VEAKITLKDEYTGTDLLTSKKITLKSGENMMALGPWEFIVLSN